jgi:bromodomain-containing protein 7/9
MGDLVEECGVQGINEQTKLSEALRSSLDAQSKSSDQTKDDAQEYIQEVAYGGVDGLAYLRSVADFIGAVGGASDAKLSKLVENAVVDYITQGRHRVLQDTLDCLQNSSISPTGGKPPSEELLHILTQKIDLSCLVRTPNELLQVEAEWSGVAFKEDRRRKHEIKKEEDLTTINGAIKDPVEYLAFALETHAQADSQGALDADDPEVFGHVLDGTGKVLRELLRGSSSNQGSSAIENSDSLTRRLRMDLLALAKRVPVDQVAFSALS